MLFYFFFLLFVCLMTSIIHDDHYFALVLFDTLNVINFFWKIPPHILGVVVV